MSEFGSSDGNFGKSYGNNFLPYDSFLSSLHKDRFLCDVIIRVNKITVPAHRVILSATSCFFYDLFKNDDPIKQEYDLTQVFCKPENLNQIFTYIYNGFINITDNNVTSLLTVNKVLGISSLKNHCAQFLLSKLRPLNVLEVWEIAWKFNLEELFNIGQIVCRETVCNLLVLKQNVFMLCEEFISLILANEDVMATVKPECVVRMLLWWMSSNKVDKIERGNKLLSLMDIYLGWRKLSEIEYQTVKRTIDQCVDCFSLILHSDIDSWLNDHYKRMASIHMSALDENGETIAEILDNIEVFDFRHGWSLLVAEKDIRTVGIYCNKKSRWFTLELEDNPLNAIGFNNNSLVFAHNSNALLLRDVDTMDSQNLTSSIVTDDNFVKCMGTQNSTFFLFLNNIYSVDAVMCTDEKNLVCIMNRWDQQRNEWITVLHLNPELSNDILSVSLTIEPSDADDVYLFMTVKRLHTNRQGPRLNLKRGENTKTLTVLTEKFVNNAREENSAVSMKPLEMFYVFCINMKDFSYRQIGKRRCEPANLNVNRKIILQDKIIFLLDPDRNLEINFSYAYHKRNDCLLNCLELFLDGENRWTNVTLRAPFPDVRDISIRKRDRICLDCFVTTCKNLLFVGTHWSPHVFQVFKYDLSTFIVSSLPAIPLPAIRQMSIYALYTPEPICDLLGEEIRIVDLINFHFKDWHLLSWEGTSV